MAQEKPLHPFPLTIGAHLTELLDPKGFEVIEIDTMPILQGYAQKLGIDHWSGNPEAHYDMTDEQAAATTLHTVVAYNCHQTLVDALDVCLEALHNLAGSELADAYSKVLEALKHVDDQKAIATATLYEPTGEVRS